MRAKKVQLIPCTEEQVETLEGQIGRRLPGCYREFLLTMGIDTLPDRSRPGWYGYSGFTGETVFYENLFDMQPYLAEQILEDGRNDLCEQLKDTTFLFYMSQGYMFAFFDLEEGDNPPVYGYIEEYEGDDFPKLTDSLVEFYERYLEFGDSPFGPLVPEIP
mgnify:CR=1 FL=1